MGFPIRPRGFDGQVGAGADEALLSILSGDSVDLAEMTSARVLEESTVGWVERNLLRDGRWQIAPAAFVDQLRTLRPAPARALIPGRQLRTMNSALRDVAAEGERMDAIAVHLSPFDANEAGVVNGDAVRIRSASGALTGRTRVDESLRAGSIWIPHGWLEPNVSRLTSADRDLDPLTGMVLQSGVAVEIEKAGSTS
jgi:predicted molibdopterin-dependent oxidoreductase YjgC